MHTGISMHYVIYGLVDPRDEAIKYVGATKRNPKQRLSEHVRDAKNGNDSRLNRWLRSLIFAGMKPLLVIITTCTVYDWQEVERQAIEALDAPLNVAVGGAGHPKHRVALKSATP